VKHNRITNSVSDEAHRCVCLPDSVCVFGEPANGTHLSCINCCGVSGLRFRRLWMSRGIKSTSPKPRSQHYCFSDEKQMKYAEDSAYPLKRPQSEILD